MTRHPATRSGNGFTLIEVVVTISLLGLVSAVLAAVFTTVIRTAPTTERRVDDARSLLGLTTWLPQDVGSTLEDGFAQGDTPSPCSGVPSSLSSPPSQGLLELSWDDGGATFFANYRFDQSPDDPSTGRIVRYTCLSGGPAEAINMTGELAKILAGPTEAPAPVDITLVPTSNGHPGSSGVRFEVIVLDEGGTQRELLTLDAETSNVVTTLAPTTTLAGTTTTTTTVPNNAPVAANLWVRVDVNDPFNVTLPATDADVLDTLGIDSLGPISPDVVLTPNPPGPLRLEIFAAASGTYSFSYTVSDGTDVSNPATLTVFVDPGSSPTTTLAPPTTTTTTTSTTVACAASINPLIPASVGIRPNGRLTDDVVVTISQSGACAPLVLSFDPDTLDANATPVQLAFNAGTTVTIDKNAYVWRRSGGKPWMFPLQLLEGANGPLKSTTNLVVTG